MTRLKDITFESGSLTGTNGADSTTGASIAIDSTSAVKGTYSGKITASAGTGYVTEQWTATDTIYISLYVKISSGPSSAAVILDIRDSGGGLYRLRADSDEIWLADGSNTQIGSRFTYSNDTNYRLGIRYTKGTGSNAIVEFFAVAGDNAFGSAVASTSAGTATAQSDRVRIGATNSQTSTFFIDNIRVDDASMPTDDVAGGTTYDQAVNVTASNSVSIVKQTNKSISFTGVSVTTIQKQMTKALSFSTTGSATVVKQAGKILSATVGNVVSEIHKQVNKNIAVVGNSTVSIVKGISKTINFTTAANVVIMAGLLFTKTISATVSTSVNITKRVDKIISAVSAVIVSMVRELTQTAIGFGRNIGTLAMHVIDNQSQSLAEKNSQIITIDPKDDTTI